MDLQPDRSPFPSLPTNDPFAQFQMAAPHGAYELSGVPELTAIGGNPGAPLYTPQGPVNNLSALRNQFPFLPVIPLPTEAVAIFLPVSGTPVEMRIPDGAAAMMLTGSAVFYLGLQGNAELPVAGNTPASGYEAKGLCKSFIPPTNFLFYVAGLRTISFVAPNNNTAVTALFYAPNEMPR
jgi:hypothetical protein